MRPNNASSKKYHLCSQTARYKRGGGMDAQLRFRRNGVFHEIISTGDEPRNRHKKVKKRKNLPVLTNFNNLKAILVGSKGGTAQSRTNNQTSGKKTRENPVRRNDELNVHQKANYKVLRSKVNKTAFDIINYLISSHHDQEFIKRHNLNPTIMAATLSRKNSKSSKKSTKRGSTDDGDSKSDLSITTRKSVLSSTSKTSKKSKRSGSRRSTGRGSKKLVIHEIPTFMLSQPDPKKEQTIFPRRGLPPKLFTFGTEPAYAYMHAFRQKVIPRKDFYSDHIAVAAIFNEAPPHYVFYPNQELAIEISKGEKGPKLIVYSMSRKNEQGNWIPSRPMAIFDSKGNGVVYDVDGRIRMNYDQVEGAMYNIRNEKPIIHWYWKGSSNIAQRRTDLETCAEDANDDIDSTNFDLLRSGGSKAFGTGSSTKSGKGKKGGKGRRKNKKNAAAAVKKSKSKIAEQERTLPPFSNVTPSPIYDIRPIVMKITDFVSLRIVDQKHIHLDYKCELIHYRLYVGFIVNTQDLERIDKIIFSKSPETLVPCYFEILPNRSESLKKINRRMVQIRQNARTERMIKAAKRARIFGYHVWFKRRRAA